MEDVVPIEHVINTSQESRQLIEDNNSLEPLLYISKQGHPCF